FNRQRDYKLSALPNLGLHANVAAVLLNHTVRNAKTKPCADAYALGGKERIKDFLGRFFVHTFTGVTDRNLDLIFYFSGLDENGAFTLNGLSGIGQNIHKDLIELARMTRDLRNITVVLFDVNTILKL